MTLLVEERPKLHGWAWRPFVGFEDTNLFGNVYFARHISWQGKCREAFLADRAPDVLAELAGGLRLITLHVACEYYDELKAFDPVELEMRLVSREGHKLRLAFDYYLFDPSERRLVAAGAQEIACMRLSATGTLVPAQVPQQLSEALEDYAVAH